jgi:DNA-binding beta-propeller fold protein YncE
VSGGPSGGGNGFGDVASDAATPVVTASSVTYSTGGYGSPFRALPLMLETNPGNAFLGYANTGGTAPVGLRLFDSGKLLAVANSNRFGTGTANATVLSVAVPAAVSVVQTIPTGLFPREITVGSDDRTLYLTNYDSGSFQVISTTVR